MFEPSSMVLNPPSMSNLNSLKAKSKSINPIHIFYFIEFEPFEYTKNYQNNAKVFKAFCDENRLAILDMLRTGEKCACDLLEELHITQPTLSHHMKILCDAGVVQGRKD